MKFLGLHSSKEVNVNVSKYKINWLKAPSEGQQIVQDFLFPYWKSDIVLAEFRIPRSIYRLDILNCTKKIVIEYSPKSHHGNYNPFFHKSRIGYLNSIKRDYVKEEWCNLNRIDVIHLDEKDLKLLSKQYFEDKFKVII